MTIANAITSAIAIAIFPISLGPNAHTYAHNRWEVGTRFRWKIGVGDLLPPRSNCLPFLRNLRLQLSAPWPWSILRSCCGGHDKDKIQAMVLSDVMILATIFRPPSATHHMPHAARQPLHNICHLRHASQLLAPATNASRCLRSATQQGFRSSMRERTLEHIGKWDWECLPSWEHSWERIVKQGENVIECNWECIWEHAREYAWDRLESWLGSI